MTVIRRGTADDVAAVLHLLDGATAWLVSQGRTGQWGTARQSDSPRRIRQVEGYVAMDGLWIATTGEEPGDEVVGALAVGPALPTMPAAGEPEVFVRLLVTDRSRKGRGIGRELLEHARRIARESGVSLVRVDCFAGGDGKLVGYYESQGFTRTHSLDVDGWPAQVLEQRLSA
ncbi:GNAT family N-acetyltransferase [Actinoplanes sp. NPDC051494]|uniref:GNAT family N-acetyltransferase n=1 Tax=Actinoplanes sp. NPDC051494 TaxID=3363907 RepID=UPI0037881651